MALNQNIKVEMPAHCVRVPKGEKVYIQYTKRSYRNAKGQPTSERIAVGLLDKESGKLIPNRNYYEIFEKGKPSSLEYVKNCGSHAVFSGIAKNLGLDRLIRKHFPEQSEEILTTAHYMFCEGNVMYYLNDWQDENVSYAKESLSGADLSRLFASLGTTERMNFFHEWMKLKYSEEFIAYDVTSISSYGKGIENLEWGYNRDKEKLPQINFGMYYGEETRLPLYYRIYPGSIPDKTHLRYMMEDNSIIACKKAKFVMDRGFYSAENLQYLTQKGCRFMIALPESLKYCQDLIERKRNDVINRSECYLGVGKPYGKAFEVTELGFRMMVHLFYDPDKAARDIDYLQGEIQRQENELSEMTEPPERKLHYDRYFYINRSKEGALSFRRNHKAIDNALSKCGFFLIAETDFTKNSAEVLDIYRRRNVIEKSFDHLKNSLDMRRLYVHNDQTVEGKAFCSFVALIVRSEFQNLLREYMVSNKFTFHKMLLELNKVKLIISAKSPNGCRLLNPPSKLIRDVFSLLMLDIDSLSVV